MYATTCKRRSQSSRRLQFESLELRELNAVGVTLSPDGLLNIQGDKNDNTAIVREIGTGKVSVNLGAGTTELTFATVKRIEFHGFQGNDRFENNTSINSVARGDAGNDTLIGGSGRDEFYGGSGNDVLMGKDGRDNLNGDADNDKLYGGNDVDVLKGGSGNDGLYGGGSSSADTLTGGSGADRFLTQDTDRIADLTTSDAQLVFKDGTDSWSNREIEVADEAFAKLHARTGNTKLLKDSVLNKPLTFVQDRTLGGNTVGKNTETYQEKCTTKFDFQKLSFVETCDTRSTRKNLRDRTIRIKDWDTNIANQNAEAIDTVLHEMGHNWDSTMEGNPQFNRFVQLNRTSKSSEFVSTYAKTNVKEDWAETFAKYFTDTTAALAKAPAKFAAVDAFFASFV